MDNVNVMTNSNNTTDLDNADHRQLRSSDCEESALQDIGDMASRNADHLEEKVIADFAADEANDETISFAVRKVDASKETGEKISNKEDNSKIVRVRGWVSGKSTSSSSKPATATLLTEHLDGNEESLTSISNGFTSPIKQPLSHATDCRLSDDGQAVEGYASPDADRSQMSGKVGAPTANTGVSLPEVLRESSRGSSMLLLISEICGEGAIDYQENEDDDGEGRRLGGEIHHRSLFLMHCTGGESIRFVLDSNTVPLNYSRLESRKQTVEILTSA